LSEKPSDQDQALQEEDQTASVAADEESKEEAEDLGEQEMQEKQPAAEEEFAPEKPEEEEAEEPKEAEEAEEAEGEEEEEEIEVVEERVYTIPFRRVWATPRGKRTPRASRMLRDFVKRHMKTDDVEISNEVNEELWARSIKKPPRQIKVRLVKDKEGRVIVYPATAA